MPVTRKNSKTTLPQSNLPQPNLPLSLHSKMTEISYGGDWAAGGKMSSVPARRNSVSAPGSPSVAPPSSQSAGPSLVSAAPLSDENEAVIARLSAHFEAVFKGYMTEMRDYFSQIIETKDKEIADLRSTVDNLRERITQLENDVDDAAAYERRDTLIFSGDIPAVTPGENTNEVVREVLRNKLKLNLQDSDLSSCHRLGRRSTRQGPDRRNIIVKLCRRDIKADILAACRANKPNFYVNESVTPKRGKILFALRRAKKAFPSKIAYVRSNEGNVVVGLQPHSRDGDEGNPGSSGRSERLRRVTINTPELLEAFLRAELNTSLEELNLS